MTTTQRTREAIERAIEHAIPTGLDSVDTVDHARAVDAILAALEPILREGEADTRRLSWLLNELHPVKQHAGGWPYPDLRGTYDGRFVGITYLEDCEARPVPEYFATRKDIDKCMAATQPKEGGSK